MAAIILPKTAPFRLPTRQARFDPNHPEDQREILKIQFIRAMLELQPEDRIGISLAVLIAEAEKHPVILRRALSEKTHREGFTGISLLELLKRAAD